MSWVKIIFNENFHKKTQFYEYSGMGMGIDTIFLGYRVLSLSWVSGYLGNLSIWAWPNQYPKPNFFGV